MKLSPVMKDRSNVENSLPHTWSVGIWVLDHLTGKHGLPNIWVECQAGLTWAPDVASSFTLHYSYRVVSIHSVSEISVIFWSVSWIALSPLPKPFHGTCSISHRMECHPYPLVWSPIHLLQCQRRPDWVTSVLLHAWFLLLVILLTTILFSCLPLMCSD